MRWLPLFAIGCGLVYGEPVSDADFVLQPADAWVQPGDTVQLDCELVEADVGDICAWRLSGTHLGVDHFYNVFPPAKVHALFPEHERVCTIVIDDVDWRHDGLWTCWPLGAQSHVSSRTARLTVGGGTTTEPQPTSSVTSSPAPTDTSTSQTTPPSIPTTTIWTTTETTEAPTTTVPASTTTVTPASTTTMMPSPTTTVAPSTTTTVTPSSTTTMAPSTTTTVTPSSTTTVAPPTTTPPPASSTSPGPGFNCPQPNGLFADPESSHCFYYCQDGIAVHMQCEWPLVWSQDQQRCA